MPERFNLTQNAQFYIPKNALLNEHIIELLDEASDNIELDADFIINEIRQERAIQQIDLEYTYSTRVFPTERQLYFFNDTDLKDRVYAYIIIIEIDGYVAILKKSCANISEILTKYFDRIDHLGMLSIFDDQEVEFQKISLRNMTVSDRALRARSYEAADLKGLLSTHAAGRSIPYFLKIRDGKRVKTITTTTGRLVESSDRKDIDTIAKWLRKQIDIFKNPYIEKPFLSSFARLVELSEVLSLVQPKAIYIESSTLYDRFENDELPLQYRNKKGKIINVSERVKEKTFQLLEEVYELNPDGSTVNSTIKSRIRKNPKTITFTSPPLTKLRTVENGKTVTLQQFIIKNGYYSICFDDPKYMYFMSTCFEDTSGISEIDSILELLIPIQNIATATSEKGVVLPASINFEQNSLFSIVEDTHSADDYIFCDDLGNEWADHITFNKDDSCIAFIHAKYGDTTTSASKLHDVVGQGIKNLGNMFFSNKSFKAKFDSKFITKYNNTAIDRIRKGNPADIENYLHELLGDYKLHRKCILCCSFISKASIETEFVKIKNGNPVSGHIIQLLWIISSFAHAAKDMNIIPIIYCNY